MQSIINLSLSQKISIADVVGRYVKEVQVYWSYYKSWHKLLINDSDKFIKKTFYTIRPTIENSQSILTAYELTGLHMKTSLYQEVMIAQLNFLTHENLWLKISTTWIKKHLIRNPQHVETGQSICTANQVTRFHINRVR